MRRLVLTALWIMLAVGLIHHETRADQLSDMLKLLEKYEVRKDVPRVDGRADLREFFSDQIRDCYILPVNDRGRSATVIELRVNVDGSLAQPPKMLRGSGARARAALRAVLRCTPFKVPEEVARRYEEWSEMKIAFEP